MPSEEAAKSRKRAQPYRSLREDPRYDELKRIIDELPPEKMEKLKSYIRRWLKRS